MGDINTGRFVKNKLTATRYRSNILIAFSLDVKHPKKSVRKFLKTKKKFVASKSQKSKPLFSPLPIFMQKHSTTRHINFKVKFKTHDTIHIHCQKFGESCD